MKELGLISKSSLKEISSICKNFLNAIGSSARSSCAFGLYSVFSQTVDRFITPEQTLHISILAQCCKKNSHREKRKMKFTRSVGNQETHPRYPQTVHVWFTGWADKWNDSSCPISSLNSTRKFVRTFNGSNVQLLQFLCATKVAFWLNRDLNGFCCDGWKLRLRQKCCQITTPLLSCYLVMVVYLAL